MRLLELFIFLYLCYRDHRDLHSFPTRRSSDLELYTDRSTQGDLDNRALQKELTKVVTLPVYVLVSADGKPLRIFQDRKSTRLNSSHGYISYAVFCLKKKTKIDSLTLASSVVAT